MLADRSFTLTERILIATKQLRIVDILPCGAVVRIGAGLRSARAAHTRCGYDATAFPRRLRRRLPMRSAGLSRTTVLSAAATRRNSTPLMERENIT